MHENADSGLCTRHVAEQRVQKVVRHGREVEQVQARELSQHPNGLQQLGGAWAERVAPHGQPAQAWKVNRRMRGLRANEQLTGKRGADGRMAYKGPKGE